MAQPKRRYEMTFTIGADSYKDMLSAMYNFVINMEREYPDIEESTGGVSGGYSAGYSYDITVDPTMTHDRYIEELNAYLGSKRTPAESDTP